jgi:hypothetical protein
MDIKTRFIHGARVSTSHGPAPNMRARPIRIRINTRIGNQVRRSETDGNIILLTVKIR